MVVSRHSGRATDLSGSPRNLASADLTVLNSVTPGPNNVLRGVLGVTLLLFLLPASLSRAEVHLRLLDEQGVPIPGAAIWPVEAPAGEGDAPSAPVVIDQRDKHFVPFVSVVAPGTLVRFPNSDDIRHHVFSFSEGNRFERKLYRANDAEPVRFATPGVVALGCNIHDNMEAYVLVRDPRGVEVTDSGGEAVLAVDRSAPLEAWYPTLDAPVLFRPSALPEDEDGRFLLSLPLTWEDPQAPRSESDLEDLLKQFSRNAQ